MGDYHVRMAFDIAATPASVMKALASTEGIASWWSDNVVGEASEVGDTYEIGFPDGPVPFQLEVVELSDTRVGWHIAEMPPPWAGTTILLEVGPASGGAKLLFEHRDFDADNPAIPIITPAWAQILLRLKQVVESGTPDAFFQS